MILLSNIFTLSLLCYAATSLRLFNRGRSVGGNLGEPFVEVGDIVDGVTAKEYWFTQKLDHFNSSDSRTWQQRYFVNDSFFEKKSSGPVFLMLGGEGEASPSWVRFGAWIDYARRFKALCFLIEHRFYGKSRPTKDLSTDNLQYLSSSQAIDDIAAFIRGMKKKHELNQGSKWIVFGGSYPGSLTVWLRSKYPQLVYGGVSSSGPLLAKLNFKEYYKVVENAIGNYSEDCLKKIRIGTKQISEKLNTADGRKEINELFHLCDEIDICVDRVNDVANYFQTLASNFAGVVQYNNDNRINKHYKVNNLTIATLCTTMLEGDNLPYNSLADVSAKILDAYNETCLDYRYEKMMETYRNVSWSSEAAEGSRQWTYQTCTEFGFFQTSDHKPRIFGDEFPLDFYTQQCEDIFGKKFDEAYVKKAVRKTNHKYGGKKVSVTNVIFVQGSIDPWHVLGINSLPYGGKNYAILIEGSAHCANMYPVRDSDSKELVDARSQIVHILSKWLGNTKLERKRYFIKY